MTKGLGFLFGAGATLVALTLVLPAAQDTREPGLWIPVVLGYVVSATLWVGRHRFGAGELHALLLGGTGLITLCVVLGGESAAAYSFMYVWVGMYAAWFFKLRGAAGHVAVAAAAYGVSAALGGDVPVPGVFWLMAVGTALVGTLLIAELSAQVRVQADDLSAVARMGAVADVAQFAQAICDGLRRSADADVVVLLEPLPTGRGLQVTGMAGTAEAGLVLNSPDALRSLERSYRAAEPDRLVRTERRGRLRGDVFGLAQPVLRDGVAAGVLVLAWTRPRRVVSERVQTAALLFAAEASVAIERQEAVSRLEERRALEINDNIVQGLVVAKYAISAGATGQAVAALEDTLARARRLITDQVDDVRTAGDVQPGDLVRAEASGV